MARMAIGLEEEALIEDLMAENDALPDMSSSNAIDESIIMVATDESIIYLNDPSRPSISFLDAMRIKSDTAVISRNI